VFCASCRSANLLRATLTGPAYFAIEHYNILLTFSSRRLARRGGVKRIAATIYDDVRQALKDRLRAVSFSQTSVGTKLMSIKILKDAIAVVELTGRKTVSVTDIIFVLNRVSRSLRRLLEEKANLYNSKVDSYTASILRSLVPAKLQSLYLKHPYEVKASYGWRTLSLKFLTRDGNAVTVEQRSTIFWSLISEWR